MTPPPFRLSVHIFNSEWAKQFVELVRNFSPSTNTGERGTKELVKREIYCDFKDLKIEEKKLQGEKAVYFLKDFFFLLYFLLYFLYFQLQRANIQILFAILLTPWKFEKTDMPKKWKKKSFNSNVFLLPVSLSS